MNLNKITNIVSSFGKGVLMGVGVGCALFGTALLSFSYNNGQTLNVNAFFTVLSGVFCILLSFAVKNRK